jgi:hypothetical protein
MSNQQGEQESQSAWPRWESWWRILFIAALLTTGLISPLAFLLVSKGIALHRTQHLPAGIHSRTTILAQKQPPS